MRFQWSHFKGFKWDLWVYRILRTFGALLGLKSSWWGEWGGFRWTYFIGWNCIRLAVQFSLTVSLKSHAYIEGKGLARIQGPWICWNQYWHFAGLFRGLRVLWWGAVLNLKISDHESQLWFTALNSKISEKPKKLYFWCLLTLMKNVSYV